MQNHGADVGIAKRLAQGQADAFPNGLRQGVHRRRVDDDDSDVLTMIEADDGVD